MRKYQIPALIAVLALSGVAISSAQQVDLGETVVKSDYVEVNRVRETKEVIVIDKKQLAEKDYDTLRDVLSDVSSINFGLGGYGQIDIRGQGKGQANRNIQILVDGAPITALTNHPFETDYDYIPVQDIEKIEIIPGGGSVMYGSGASGGVINITTNLNKMDKPMRSITLGVGNDETNYSVAVGDRISDKISYQINKTKVDRDLYFKDTYQNRDYLSLGAAINLDEKQTVNLRYSKAEIDGKGTGSVKHADFVKYGKDYVPKGNNYRNLDKSLETLAINYDKEIDDSHDLTVNLFKVNSAYSNLSLEQSKLRNKTKGIKVKYDIEYGDEQNNKLLLGYDLINQNAVSVVDYGHRKSMMDYEKTTNSVFANNVINKGRYVFSQGIRYEHVNWAFDKITFDKKGNGVRHSNDIGANLGVAYRYSDTGRVYANVERGFTQPDGIQIADKDPNVSAEFLVADMKDETYYNYELGWTDKIGESLINVVGFYSVTNDEIGRIGRGRPHDSNAIRYSRNMFKTKRRGIDVSATQKFGKLELKESYTYLKGRRRYTDDGLAAVAEFASKMKDFNVSALQSVPKHKFVIAASYEPNDDWRLRASYKFVGKYDNLDIEDKKFDRDMSPCKQLVDFDVAFKGIENTRINFGVKNLFNKKYDRYRSAVYNHNRRKGPVDMDYDVVPGDERTYYASVTYKF